ncbi:hypothetical protein ABIE44_001255 [Marmoricola sp. OAE513]|uniref:hypothetical protein n=1 Tax=Marmoricola sp. OAE513 TaxID=2817894 RepID=UPI001AE1BD14
MPADVESPFGSLSWADVGLIAVAVLGLGVLVVGVVVLRSGARWPLYLVLVSALACGAWTVLWLSKEVTVVDPEDPHVYCVFDDWSLEYGGLDKGFDWDWECGRALRKRLWVSIGPTGLAIAAVAGLGVSTVVRRRSA